MLPQFYSVNQNTPKNWSVVILYTPVFITQFDKMMMMIWWCLCVATWQAKLNEQREQAKQVAKFNLHMSESRKTTNCPLLPVSSWIGICSLIKMSYFFCKEYICIYINIYICIHTHIYACMCPGDTYLMTCLMPTLVTFWLELARPVTVYFYFIFF